MSGHLPFAHAIDVVAASRPSTSARRAPDAGRVAAAAGGAFSACRTEMNRRTGSMSFRLRSISCKRLRRGAILEQHVERPPLLGDEIREVAQTPLLHLADRPALLLDERPDAGGQLLRARPRPAPDGSGRVSHSGDPPCTASHCCCGSSSAACLCLSPLRSCPAFFLRRPRQAPRPSAAAASAPPRRPRRAWPRRSAAAP